MKRLVFIAVSLVLLQFCSAQNYIVNGNFTEPSPIAPPKTYEFTNSLTGWTSSADGGKLQRGIGSVYNPKWGATKYVAELDGQFGNYILSQSVELRPGRYTLSFSWAGRKDKIKSSGIQVKWMGKSIYSATATDSRISQQKILLLIKKRGSYTLEFSGQSDSDTFGATITNVRLQKQKPNQDETCQSGNLIQNGNFAANPLTSRWQLVDYLSGWTTSSEKQMQRGFGDVYNRNWGNTAIVMELDGNANYKMQQMVYSEKGNHVLSFRWAAREGKYSTSAMSIYWNGTKVFTHAPTAVAEYSIHYESIPIVVAQRGVFLLQVEGEANSDQFGITVTDFWLGRQAQDLCSCEGQVLPENQNLFVNGDFKTPLLTSASSWELVQSLPGWMPQTGKLERGYGTVYNSNWEPSTIVVELDASANYVLKQTLYLSPGSYFLSFRWARRTSKTTTSAMSVLLNNNVIDTIPDSVSDNNVYQKALPITITEHGTYQIKFRGDDDSDGYGMTIANVRLYCDPDAVQDSSSSSDSGSSTTILIP